MNLFGGYVGVALLCALVAACDGPTGPDDSPGNDDAAPTLSDIVGTWVATRLQFTSQADASVSDDPIQRGGMATLTISADQRWTYVRTLPGKPTETTTGSLRFERGFLVIEEDGFEPVDWLYQKDDDLMTLEGESEHDFDDDGEPEPAHANYTFERR